MTEGSSAPCERESVPPVEPREFAFALQIGSATFSGRMPMANLSQREFFVGNEEGDPTRVVLDDNRWNRAAVAILDHFVPDIEKFQAVMLRYMALLRLTRGERMQAWQQPAGSENKVAVHPAILIVASTLPLLREGAFDEEEFFAKVKEVAAAGKTSAGG